MNETLKKLWNGNLEPWSEKWERSGEAEHLADLLEHHKTALVARLDAVGKETLEKYEDRYEKLESIGCEEAFQKGFSLGAKLFAKALMR